MADRKRTVFAVIIALVVVIALLYSFSMNLFSRTPQLVLPNLDEVGEQEPGPGTPGVEAGIKLDIVPDTVQSVIASLSRYESYSRTVLVTYYWGDDESETISSQVWEDDGWVRTDSALSSGVIESSIVGDGNIWLWYDDGTEESEGRVYTGKAEESAADRIQHIPTYEEVLELDPAHITDAAYVKYEGQPCIYVEAEHQVLGYLYRYWISESNGMLVASETEKSGVLVYRMESNEVISPSSAGHLTFALPNGEILHEAA